MALAAMPEQVGHEPAAAPVETPASEIRSLETRFGTMEFVAADDVRLPRGILGFAEHRDFGLAYLPNKFIDDLMLLQSLSDPNTSFLVLPVATDSGVIEDKDLNGACGAMDIDPEYAALLLIVTIRDGGGVPEVTVNMRAPVILDTANRQAWQYVLPNAKYSMRHPLNLGQTKTAEDGAE